MDTNVIAIDPETAINEEPINIHRSVATICKKLGLDPNHVRSIQITPRGAIVQVYKLNQRGYKYIDEVTEQVAVDTLTFRVQA